MTNKLIIILLALCFGAVAQVNLTGTVSDSISGSPIAGVVVSLKVLKISGTTNAQGQYIVNAAARVENAPAEIMSRSSLVGTHLRLAVTEPSPAVVELFSATGAKISTLFKNGNLQIGIYDINLFASGVAPGLYFIRVRVGNQSLIHRYLLMQTAVQSIVTNSLQPDAPQSAAKRVAVSALCLLCPKAIDTLAFSKAGYGPAAIPIFSYTGNNDAYLMASIATDTDGNVYQIITIGTQVWMAENLKTTRYNNGTSIPLVSDSALWMSLSEPGFCWYHNEPAAYKNTYGALYNWYAVNTGKLAPMGWHVPTNSDWTTLSTYLGGPSLAGGKLKETGTANWNSPNTGATNSTGFTALPGGARQPTGAFKSAGVYGGWWASAADTSFFEMDYNDAVVTQYSGTLVSHLFGLSVRCIRD
jgi:uncharacterized protein (TIGR02145 family)